MRTVQLVIAGLVLAACLYTAQTIDRAEIQLQAAINKETIDGDLKGAIAQYQKILTTRGVARAVAAKALLHLGQCQEKLGSAEARKAYERLVMEFADQAEPARVARERLSALGTGRRGEMVTRRVWAGDSVDFSGTPSPDGRYLSFMDQDTGNLAVRDLTIGQNRSLTGNKDSAWTSWAGYSVISPDGNQVAYSWRNAQNRLYELRVIGIGGSGSRLLYSHPEVTYIQPADWSPDGKHILAALTKKDKTIETALVSVSDGSVRVLQTSKQGASKATFSPDGRYIAYDRQRDIFMLDIDTRQEVPVALHPSDDAVMGWAPDGKSIIFTSDRAQTTDVWMIDMADGKPQSVPRLLKKGVGHIRRLGFTRAGSYYYGVSTRSAEVYLAEFDPATGKGTGGLERAAGGIVNSTFMADWSADAKRLAYLVGRPGEDMPSVVVVRSVDTGEEREISLKLSARWSLRWHPDGRSLLVRGSDENREGLFRVDAQTGDTSLLVPSKFSNIGGFDYSPDGASVFYAGDDPGDNRGRILRVRDLKTGQDSELARHVLELALSPDGRRLVYLFIDGKTRSQRLMIMPAAGGPDRELIGAKEDEAISTFAWTQDSSQVIFAKCGGSEQQSTTKAMCGLWRVATEGGEPQRLDLTADGILRGLRVHPDGRRLAYGVWKFTGEVWVMENFLPVSGAAK